MISVVNGYTCYSSCDVAAAKQGKDPSAPPGSPPGTSGKADKTSGADKTSAIDKASSADKTSGADKAYSFDNQPATILDGVLKDAASANALTGFSGAATSGGSSSSLVDLLV